MKWLIPALALSLPFAAAAQSNDTKYCSDLSTKYERYLGQSLDRSPQPQSLDAKIAVGKCGAGETAATIPVLEKALRNGKIELPPRT
jgi:hypothetical protein